MRFKKSCLIFLLLTTQAFSADVHYEQIVSFKKNSIACDRTLDLEKIPHHGGSYQTTQFKAQLAKMFCIVIPTQKKYKIISLRKTTEVSNYIESARKNDPYIEIMDLENNDALQSKWTYARNVK
jgi:hypothetical protein